MTTASAFTRPEIDLESTGRHKWSSFEYKVRGFRSEPVKLYIRCDQQLNDDGLVEYVWSFEVTNSSGGRDTTAEPDNAVAMTNFAHAILDAVALSRELEAQVDTLNHYRQLADAEYEVKREAERREREAVMAADPAMGEADAKRLLIDAREMAKVSDKGEVTLVVYSRGDVRCNRIVAKSLGGNSMRYQADQENITRKDLLTLLKKSSHRSHIEI